MGFLGKILGTTSDFKASGTDLGNPTNDAQIQRSYGDVNQALGAQRSFVDALAAQGGLGNQSNVFAQQQALANQLGQQAQGQGPNPAMAQLSNSTGQNIANQASLMAGQRGASANAGLLARQAGMQGAATQQQAVGQGAAMQAQQQIAAQQALQAQQAQMAGMANTQVSNQAQGLGALNQGQQSQQQNLLNAQAQRNNAGVGLQSNLNSVNAGVASANAANNAGIVGGLIGGAGSAISASMGVPAAAHGGMIGTADTEPRSHAARFLSGYSDGGAVMGKAKVAGDSSKNDVVPAILSPGEIVIPRSVLASKDPVAAAAEFVKKTLARHSSGKAKDHFDDGGEVFSPDEVDDIKASGQGPMPDAPAASAFAPPPFLAANPDQQAQTYMPENPIKNMVISGRGEMGAQQGGGAMSSPMQASSDMAAPDSFDMQKNAVLGEANAMGAAGKREAAINANTVEQLGMAQKKADEEYQGWQQQRQHLLDDYGNGKVDPNRFLGSMSTPQKVGTAIGLILGGIGGGLTHQENPALKFINQQIDNDIKAQESDLSKKHNLLSANLQQFGEMKAAQAMTRANLLDMAALKLKQEAASSQDPLAKAHAQTAIASLNAQAEQAMAPLKKAALLRQLGSSGQVPPDQLISLVPEKDQPKAREELSRAQEVSDRKSATMDAFDTVSKASTLAYKVGHPRRAWSGAQENQLNGAIAELNKALTGRFNNEENKQLYKQFVPKMSDTDEDIALKRKQLEKYSSMTAGFPTLMQHGIDPQKFQSTTTDSYTKLDPQKKSWVDWAQKNPNDPKAQVVLQKLGIR